MPRIVVAVLLSLAAGAAAQASDGAVEFAAVVNEAGDQATFSWRPGQDLGAAAKAFCAAHVAADLQAQCVPAISAQVEHVLAERKVPALELTVQVAADETAVFKHRDGGDLRAEASAFCEAHVPAENVAACAHALVEGAVQKSQTPARDPLEAEAPVSAYGAVLGPVLVQAGAGLSVAALETKKNVALLFAADWCKPCRDFVPKLKKYYELQRRKGADALEIVWVSASKSQAAFDAYAKEMPWPAVPLGSAAAVIQKFQTRGFPTLCFVDKRGAVITCDGVKKVMGDPYGMSLPYRTPAQKAARLVRGAVGVLRAAARLVKRR